MKRLCVFCGSRPGAREIYTAAARQLGATLANHQIELVYGGGRIGLMGSVADAAMEAGGRVTGIIPRALAEAERAHTALTELHIVNSMHERKALMADMSDAFIMLPGGFGTLEEFAEILTWVQLGIHQKPCGILNVGGFYDPLLTFFDYMLDQQFIRPMDRSYVIIRDEIPALLDALMHYQPNFVPKWLDESQR
jgi:uncharacterized protein (TIGR00730 family)